jgi:hypothetical protein
MSTHPDQGSAGSLGNRPTGRLGWSVIRYALFSIEDEPGEAGDPFFKNWEVEALKVEAAGLEQQGAMTAPARGDQATKCGTGETRLRAGRATTGYLITASRPFGRRATDTFGSRHPPGWRVLTAGTGKCSIARIRRTWPARVFAAGLKMEHLKDWSELEEDALRLFRQNDELIRAFFSHGGWVCADLCGKTVRKS